MSTFRQDLRYAVRMLLGGGPVTLVAIITLALGIGANTAIFTIVNAILLKPLPFERPEELVVIGERHGQRPISVSWLNYLDWTTQARSFSEMGATNGVFLNLTSNARSRTAAGTDVLRRGRCGRRRTRGRARRGDVAPDIRR
jgi:putative ABC transport system permease protein